MARTQTSGKLLKDNQPAPYSFACGFTPVAGRCLVIYGSYVNSVGSGAIASVTDNLSATWTLRENLSPDAVHHAFIAWRENIPGGITNVIVNDGADSGYLAIAIDEFDGIISTSAFDQTNSGTGSMASAAVSSGNITTTQASELLLTSANSDDSSSGVAWDAIGGSGTWTQSFQEQDTSAHAAAQSGYQIVSSTGTYNSTQRYTPSTNTNNDCVLIVSLKAIAATNPGNELHYRPRPLRRGPWQRRTQQEIAVESTAPISEAIEASELRHVPRALRGKMPWRRLAPQPFVGEIPPRDLTGDAQEIRKIPFGVRAKRPWRWIAPREGILPVVVTNDMISTGTITFGELSVLNATGNLLSTDGIVFGELSILDATGNLLSTDGIVFSDSALLNAIGDLTSIGNIVFSELSVLDAIGDLLSTGTIIFTELANLDGGSMVSTGTIIFTDLAVLTATGDLLSTGLITFGDSVVLNATGDLISTDTTIFGASPDLSSSNNIFSTGTITFTDTALLNSTGVLNSIGTLVFSNSMVLGDGSVVATRDIRPSYDWRPLPVISDLNESLRQIADVLKHVQRKLDK